MKARLSVLTSLATSLLVSAAEPGSLAPTGAVPAPAPAIEDFARAPLMSGATLSPDGRHYAAIVSWEDERRGIAVINIDEGKRVGGLRGGGDIDVYRLFWHGDDRLLFQISKENIYAYGLYSAPLADLDGYIPIQGLEWVSIIGQPRARPERVLSWTINGLLNELRVNKRVSGYHTSQVARYPDLPGLTLAYEADREGELSFGLAWQNETASLYPWDAGSRAWSRPVPIDLDTLWPKETDFDPAYVWVVHNDGAASHLRRMKIATGELEAPVYSDRAYELGSAGLLFSRAKRALVGLRFSQHRVKHVWLDPDYAEIQRAIEAALPKDEDHRIIEFDATGRRFLVDSSGPRQPGVTHIYDRDSGRLTRATEQAPHLPRERLRPASPVRFTSRDGLEIHGYLTLPAGASKERPVPLVVLPHGGPVVRDFWVYNPLVQFLASRGYAVLQPNYRASAGYLWPNYSETVGDFAGMRDDVIDATRSALRSGLFDERRVAILGGSFGGYLALACSTEEPGLYHAAISFAGVFDWARMLKKIEPIGSISLGFDRWRERLGDPLRDKARFDGISVLKRLDRLQAPVLLAHGKIDRTVDYEQTKRLAAELRQRDHPHEVIYFQDAPHGLPAFKDRVAYYRAVESFLARHLASSP